MHNWMALQDYYNATEELTVPLTAVPCKVIAITGYSGDWAAYRGPSDWTDSRVARHGDKVIREAAEGLFPTFRNLGLSYRE